MHSLIASSMLNEGFWQRVWASADRRTLHAGAGLGFTAIVLVIFLSGFGGWLAHAAGLIGATTNKNLYLMQVRCQPSDAACCIVRSCVCVCLVCF